MEMENEDKRPVVWVARRLNRRMSGCMGSTIAYFTSKARVQSVTRRFLKNGKEVKVEKKETKNANKKCTKGQRKN